jgi:hypothetical protein
MIVKAANPLTGSTARIAECTQARPRPIASRTGSRSAEIRVENESASPDDSAMDSPPAESLRTPAARASTPIQARRTAARFRTSDLERRPLASGDHDRHRESIKNFKRR